MIRHEVVSIDPLKDLGPRLLEVEKPGRYVGGEYGRLSKPGMSFSMAIAFPDLYEIGMSNQAIRILYNNINALEDISCDRVFAPAPDFEALLSALSIPLYTLDLGTPLNQLDLLGFSLGYELGINGVLSILDSGDIPIRSSDRGEEHPLIVMGGPAASNPAPYARFIDALWVGEAEDRFFNLVERMRDAKRAGAGRTDLLALMSSDSAVWVPGKKAHRAVDADFASGNRPPAVYPIPSIRIIQDHGSVEIMRGCPNGCRFCHAGVWYRPMRQKDEAHIRAEVSEFVEKGGYREVTLSSLSTGDYDGIENLIRALNKDYAGKRISFQLPSLKVSSFSLPLIESVSETRKSGLTFAIETPMDAWQLSINKEVARDTVIGILNEAKKHGWKSAKFYFMIGLPVGDYQKGYDQNNEEKEIVDFLLEIRRRTGVSLNVNVGTFVPKPHTPYQWVPQIDEKTALAKLMYIKNALRPFGFKISTHDTFVSSIEGLLSRGDERVGEIIENAYRSGCRLDAWNEYINRDQWKRLFSEYTDVVEAALAGRDLDQQLPWNSIDSGVGLGFLKKEYLRSNSSELTPICTEDCTAPCGACRGDTNLVKNIIHNENLSETETEARSGTSLPQETPKRYSLRMLFSFTKTERAVFIPHLGLIELFSKSFMRASIPVHYTEGFNPLPKMDFASPLSMGIASNGEIASVDLDDEISPERFILELNNALPSGFVITRAQLYTIPEGAKKYSTPALLWGVSYDRGSDEDLVPAAEEKKYRERRLSNGASLFDLRRKSVLARGDEGRPEDYFQVYRTIYSKA